MKYVFLNFFLLISYISQAQNIREQTVELGDGSKLTYQLLNGSLNGLFSVKNDGVTMLRGNYVDDKRVGNWYFFNPDNTLYMRYNYDQHKLLFIDDKVLTVANIRIVSEEEEVKTKASIPVPLLSLSQYYALVLEAAKRALPEKYQILGTQLPVELVASIDKNGIAKYSVNYIIKDKLLKTSFLIDKPEFKVEWVPSALNGKNYPSEFTIKTDLIYSREPDQIKRFYWNR